MGINWEEVSWRWYDKKDIPNIFTKFFRTKNARAADTKGFGVGLYLAQAITHRHRGNIGVESSGVGLGATFTITLKYDYIKSRPVNRY